jgi:hypothetical protein
MGMPSTSFYLPDDVALELERYKDRLNVSQVCTRAVREKIAQLQLLDRSVQDADANIERLRREKATAHAEDEIDGRRAAARYVTKIDYTTLRTISGFDLTKPVPLSGQLESTLEDEFIADMVGATEDLMADRDIWTKGWLAFMQEYWARIKDQL